MFKQLVSQIYVLIGGTPTAVSDVNKLPVFDSVADANFDSVRIRKGDYLETEDVLYDIPVTLTDSFIYIGVAPAGTATSASLWYVRRISFNGNKLPFKDQFRSGVVWDNRASGWV